MIGDVWMTEQAPSGAIGARVRDYRTRLNMSQAKLAHSLGLKSAQIVSQIESGQRELKAIELVKAAEVLMTSAQNLLTDAPLAIPTARWRDKPSSGFEDAEARLCLRCERYALLEEWCDERINRDLPGISFSKERIPKIGEVEKVADEVRITMELGGRPASSLKDTLEEDYGVKVFHDTFEGTALCVSSSFGKAILLNRNNVRGRRNFSLAHELYHLLAEGIYSEEQHEQEEKHAHIFASSLLIPSSSVIAHLDAKANDGRILIRDLVSTAQDFHVSTEALLWRLCNLQRMGRDAVRGLIGSDSLKAFEAHSQRKSDIPEDLPERFTRLAFEAYRRGKLGKNKLAQFLETTASELPSNSDAWDMEVALDEEAEIALA